VNTRDGAALNGLLVAANQSMLFSFGTRRSRNDPERRHN
jgi:hypothetical protein